MSTVHRTRHCGASAGAATDPRWLLTGYTGLGLVCVGRSDQTGREQQTEQATDVPAEDAAQAAADGGDAREALGDLGQGRATPFRLRHALDGRHLELGPRPRVRLPPRVSTTSLNTADQSRPTTYSDLRNGVARRRVLVEDLTHRRGGVSDGRDQRQPWRATHVLQQVQQLLLHDAVADLVRVRDRLVLRDRRPALTVSAEERSLTPSDE